MTSAIKLNEDVTITLPVQQWDALLRSGDRSWADSHIVYEGSRTEALFTELGLDLGNLRNRATEAVELATPGAASRRSIVKAHIESLKPELDKATQRDLKRLVADCIKAYTTRKDRRGWDHLGHGDGAPGGYCGRDEGISVTMTAGPPNLHIARSTPYFDGRIAFTFSKAELGILRDCVRKATRRRINLIADEWGGGEWVSYKLNLTSGQQHA